MAGRRWPTARRSQSSGDRAVTTGTSTVSEAHGWRPRPHGFGPHGQRSVCTDARRVFGHSCKFSHDLLNGHDLQIHSSVRRPAPRSTNSQARSSPASATSRSRKPVRLLRLHPGSSSPLVRSAHVHPMAVAALLSPVGCLLRSTQRLSPELRPASALALAPCSVFVEGRLVSPQGFGRHRRR